MTGDGGASMAKYPRRRGNWMCCFEISEARWCAPSPSWPSATEDHPLEYLDFEGIIPQGQYGGGTVMVWDIGTYEIVEGNYWKGNLNVSLKGKKLHLLPCTSSRDQT